MVENVDDLNRFLDRNVPYEQYTETVVSLAYLEMDSRGRVIHDAELYDFAKAIDSSLKKVREDLHEFFSFLKDEELKDLVYDWIEESSLHCCDSSLPLTRDIRKLVLGLLEIKEQDVVFEVGSNYGYFLADCLRGESNIRLKGIEEDRKKVLVSRMLLSMFSSSYEIEEGNVLDFQEDGYSKAFTFPVLTKKVFDGMESRESFLNPDIKFSKSDKVEWIYIDRMLSKLNPGGRAVALLTGGALFNTKDKEYRSFLLEQGLIEAIIELPERLVRKTSIKIYALVFSFFNKKVKIIDGESFVLEKKYHLINGLDSKGLLSFYDSKDVVLKDKEELSKEENLIPSILLLKKKEFVNGEKIKEFANVFLGCQYTSMNFKEYFTKDDTIYRILTSNDIQNSLINYDSLQRIDYKENKFDKYAIKKGDILLTNKSPKMKIAIVDIDPKEKILVTGGMLVIRPDLEKVDPRYIKIFLESSDGRDAIKRIQKGTVIFSISPKDLENVVVPIPELEFQKKKGEEYNSLLLKLLSLTKEMKEVERRIEEFTYE